MAAASRCRASSWSRACCFLLPLEPRSLDLVRRKSKPKLERRGGCDLPLPSGIDASLSLGGEAPPLGVRGRLVLTIVMIG
jgi:hypothetical protein